MPPVSQRYRNARRRQVLDAARECFAAKGFEATSMQQICTQSGLSTGAVYGYFPSKDDLVEAIVEEALAAITAELDALEHHALEHHEAPVLHEALAQMLAVLDRPEHGCQLANLVVQVRAHAAANPALKTRLATHYRAMHARFATLIEHCQRSGTLDPDLSRDELAAFITTLGPAFLSQRALLGDTITAEAFTNIVRALTQPRPTAGRGGDMSRGGELIRP